MPSADRVTQIRRGVSLVAAGAVAYLATEALPVTPAPVANAAPGENSSTFKPAESRFSMISDRALGISSAVKECIAELYLRAFSEDGKSEEIKGRRIVVFNSSNPSGTVTLEVTENQPFRGTDKGKDTYQNNTKNVVTGDNHAKLQGDPIKELCGPVDPNCKKTEISGYEEDEAGKGEVKKLVIECPSQEVCVAWGNWPIKRYYNKPTPTATVEPTATVVPTATIPPFPTKLPVMGN